MSSASEDESQESESESEGEDEDEDEEDDEEEEEGEDEEEEEKGPSPTVYIQVLKTDETYAPYFNEIIRLFQTLTVRPYLNSKDVIFGEEAFSLAGKCRIGKSKEETVDILQKMFEQGFFVDLTEVGSLKNAKVPYGLFTSQGLIPIYATFYSLKENFQELKAEVQGGFRKELFKFLLNDSVLGLVIMRQANLEEMLNDERDEYRLLFEKYKVLKVQNFDHHTGQVRHLEKELTREKRQTDEKDKRLKYLKSLSASERRNSQESRSTFHTQSKSTINRLKDDIVRLENDNETLVKHNEILVKKYGQLREETLNSLRNVERERQNIVELTSGLEELEERYQEVLASSSSISKTLVDGATGRVDMEKQQREESETQVDLLEEQMNQVSNELREVHGSLKTMGGSKRRDLAEVTVSSMAEKVQKLIDQMS